MNIDTNRLKIRQITDADATEIFNAMICREINIMHGNQFTSINDVQEYIKVLQNEYNADKYRTMAISEKNTNILIGTITLDKDKVFPRAEISYWITISHRNAGYATEAVKEVIVYGFNNMLLNRIQAMHFPNNLASRRVLIKAGMQYEGTLRQYIGMGEEHLDCLMYSILRKDYIEYTK